MVDLLGLAIVPKLLEVGIWWDVQDAIERVGNAFPCADRQKPTEGRACVLLVPIGDAHAAVVQDLQRQHILEIRAAKGRIPQSVQDIIRPVALARAVVKGWSGLELGGVAVEYSEAKAVELLADKRLTLFARLIENCAGNDAALLAHEEDQAKGNSPAV